MKQGKKNKQGEGGGRPPVPERERIDKCLKVCCSTADLDFLKRLKRDVQFEGSFSKFVRQVLITTLATDFPTQEKKPKQ